MAVHTRRGVLSLLLSASTLAVTGCSRDGGQPTKGRSADRPAGILQWGGLAVPEADDLTATPLDTGEAFREAWEVRFTVAPDALAAWQEDSFGAPDHLGRVHVTSQKAQDAFGVDQVPDTWLGYEGMQPGTAIERLVLADDASPRTVRVVVRAYADM